MTSVKTDRYVTVDGLRIRYRDEGDGPPVVLLHGAAMGSSLDVWDRHYAPLVSAGLRLIAYDRPGFGGSDDPHPRTAGPQSAEPGVEPQVDQASPAFQRGLVIKLLDAWGLERAGLVGHSQAGGFSIQLGLDHPERISRVMVLGTGSLLPPLEGVPPNPPDLAGEPTREKVRTVLEEQLYHHELITPEIVEARYQSALGHPPRQAAAPPNPDGTPGAPTPLWQRLDELTVPLMLIYGADDRGSVPARAEILAERYPNVAVWVVPHCKHLVQWDAAEEFIAAAKDFFGA